MHIEVKNKRGIEVEYMNGNKIFIPIDCVILETRYMTSEDDEQYYISNKDNQLNAPHEISKDEYDRIEEMRRQEEAICI